MTAVQQPSHAFGAKCERSPLILVIGEDPLMTRTIVRLLRRAGYRVVIRDWDDERAVPVAPDLVVVDDPDDRTATTASCAPDVAVVAEVPTLWISNRPNTTGDPTLIKPFTSADLLQTVALILLDPAPQSARVS